MLGDSFWNLAKSKEEALQVEGRWSGDTEPAGAREKKRMTLCKEQNNNRGTPRSPLPRQSFP